jgi:hypothetical protein
MNATSLLERERDERNESPQSIAHRAYAEALGRLDHDGPDLDTLRCEEAAIKAALVALQRHYQLNAEPWLKLLSKLEAMKPITFILPRSDL